MPSSPAHVAATAMVAVIAAGMTSGIASAEDKLPLPVLNEATVAELSAYLDTQGQPPETYIASRFDEHDVVFVGEIHYLKHDVELIQRLIPVLYDRDVRVLAIEFARREDQPLIDRLLSADAYDEPLAREIQFRQFCEWAYREYLGLYRVAWELNRGLADGDPAFRILGVNNSPDWSVMQTAEDRDSEEKKRLVWHGETEADWARVILDQVEAGEQVLVYSGMHHAFSEFHHPIVDGRTGEVINFEGRRMGNHVFNAIGKRAITVGLHVPWPGPKWEPQAAYPVGGVIDALMRALGPDAYPVGFDVAGSPFGSLTSDDHVYAAGTDDFTLAKYCDGYVFTKPISAYEGCEVMQDFVNEENLERARSSSPSPAFRQAVPLQFILSAARAANAPVRYRRFH